ncbi:MAG TPA: hypothetical protein VJ904_05575, partial [Tichowtungia sp.]|nr:hypothetical protein [Tichowtungia sp.]
RYNDADFYQKRHRREDFEDSIYYLGEVNSVTGPSDWYRVYQSALPKMDERPGYDSNIYKENHDRLLHVFNRWRLSEAGSGNIKAPGDISVQAGRGMMYIHGRHAQSIMCNNTADGYALNGWSTGPQSEGDYLDWDSGILDEGRFLKGPPESFSWWIRPLQISLSRINGKYFEPGDTAELQMNLINQGLLPPGDYRLKLSATDGQDEQTGFSRTLSVTVTGGDTFAQSLGDLSLRMEPEWRAGYITIHAKLLDGKRVVADGAEQVLLRNRPSQQKNLAGLEFEIIHWPAAKAAVDESGYNAETKDPASETQIHRKFILAGDLTKRFTPRMKEWDWDLNLLLER